MKFWALAVILAGCVACHSVGQNYKAFKLPSGKEIKLTSMGRMDFPNGPPALVLNYQTDISIDDKTALRAEVDEIWSVFRNDVENAHLTAGSIRATHIEGSGLVTSGKGYGFVFAKREDGKWHCLEDEKEAN
jgi:hypothetical protein